MPKTKAKPSKSQRESPGAWVIQEVPRDLMRKARASATLHGKTVRQLVIDLMAGHIRELERRGVALTLAKEK